MTLSNTATPTYYGRFRDIVTSGGFPVSREIEAEMNRIDQLIANPNYFYDDKAIDGFIRFCEGEMTLTDGNKLHLLDSFKLWAEQIFGWYYFEERQRYEPPTAFTKGGFVTKVVKLRLTRRQYLIVARGAAKSMYASLVQSYFLTIDPTTTQQITTAPTMKQAEEVMAPIRTAISRSRGPLFRFLTEGSLQNTSGSKANRTKLAATKKGIENFLTNSMLEVRPMSIDKMQGARPKVASVDEWLSGDIREDVVGALTQGASKNDNYLILAISSEGTVRNSSGDTIKLELQSILRGEYDAPHVSIWHYKLDELSEVNQPEMWRKANPNLGLTISYEEYHLDVERAEKAPASRNDILAKRFGIPMEGHSYFFSYDETLPHRIRAEAFDGMTAALGADLSQGDDFCAFTLLFPLRDGSFGMKTRSYITQRTLDLLPGALRQKYQQFIGEETLVVMEGTVLEIPEVYDDLINWIEEHEFDVRAMGYDPYNAKEFLERWTMEHGPYFVEKVIQGSRTESVPLGELKKMATDRMLIFSELLMMFAMGNSVVQEDTNGNRKLIKKRHEEKIDNVAAAMDAYVAYKLYKDQFE